MLVFPETVAGGTEETIVKHHVVTAAVVAVWAPSPAALAKTAHPAPDGLT
jgi:hypothetical protein